MRTSLSLPSICPGQEPQWVLRFPKEVPYSINRRPPCEGTVDKPSMNINLEHQATNTGVDSFRRSLPVTNLPAKRNGQLNFTEETLQHLLERAAEMLPAESQHVASSTSLLQLLAFERVRHLRGRPQRASGNVEGEDNAVVPLSCGALFEQVLGKTSPAADSSSPATATTTGMEIQTEPKPLKRERRDSGCDTKPKRRVMASPPKPAFVLHAGEVVCEFREMLTIGRGKPLILDNDDAVFHPNHFDVSLVMPDETRRRVSRHHAVVWWEGVGYQLLAYGRNGINVSGKNNSLGVVNVPSGSTFDVQGTKFELRY
eukprot:PhM_4_TR11504/c0_g1_i1/m.97121